MNLIKFSYKDLFEHTLGKRIRCSNCNLRLEKGDIVMRTYIKRSPINFCFDCYEGRNGQEEYEKRKKKLEIERGQISSLRNDLYAHTGHN